MSRGLGNIQRLIVQAASSSDGPISAGQLRWQIAREQGRLTDEGISEAFYKSFQRSLGSLRRAGELTTSDVKLKEMSEVTQIYPYCTRCILLHEERKRLLPLLQEHAAKQIPHFTDAASEASVVTDVHIKEQRAGNRRSLLQASTRWRKVEPLVLEALRSGGGESTELLIDILTRGRGLFQVFSEHSSTRLLTQSALALRELSSTDGGARLRKLSRKLDALIDMYIPKQRMRSAELKGDLYHFVDFERFTRPRLKQEAMQYLCSRPEAELVEPGCSEAPSERYALIESRLLGRDVLAPQQFVEAPSSTS